MEPYMGQILLNAVTFTPAGWHVCDGSLLQITEHSTLFSLLGNRYGGDGRTTFALPKLKSPDNVSHYIIALKGVYPHRA